MSIKYDARAIENDIRIEEVLFYYGFSGNRRGKFRCPSVDHNDANPSASISPRGNFCKCFSCNRNFGPINLVMNRENMTFPEACEFLINNFGLNKSDYCEQDDRYNNAIPQGQKFPLTMHELRVLDWDMGSRYMELKDDEGRVYECRDDCPTLKDYFREAPDLFYGTLCEKIEQTAMRLIHQKMFFNDSVIKDMKRLVEKKGSFDECKQLLSAYVEAKKNEQPQTFSKEDEDILVEMLFLRDTAKSAKQVDKNVQILWSITEALPSFYKKESLVELVSGVKDMGTYTPELLNEELEEYMTTVDKEYER